MSSPVVVGVVAVHHNRVAAVALAGFAQAPDLALRLVRTTPLRLVAAVMLLRRGIAHQRVVTPYLALLPQPAAAAGGLLASLPILQKATAATAALAVERLVCFRPLQAEQAARETRQIRRRHKAAMAETAMLNPHIKPKAAVAALAR